MAEWIEAASLDALTRKKKLVVSVDGVDVLLYLHEGTVYAMADICIHKQKRLSKGLIFQGKLICPGHQWAFDVNTGWEDVWSRCQPVYDVRVTGDRIEVFTTSRVIETKPVSASA